MGWESFLREHVKEEKKKKGQEKKKIFWEWEGVRRALTAVDLL